jgi:hypothetical protein
LYPWLEISMTMLRDDHSNGLGQQATSAASPTVVTEGAERSPPAAGKAKKTSAFRIAIGVVALALSLLKLVPWLNMPSRPTVTSHPIVIPQQPGELSRLLPKCELVFPAGQGAIPGVNCFKSGGSNSDIRNTIK